MRVLHWAGIGGVCLMLCACGGAKNSELIVGKWDAADKKDVVQSYQFEKDGTVKLTLNDGKTAAGKYKFTDDSTMDVEYDVPEEVKVAYRESVKAYKRAGEEAKKALGSIPGVGGVASQGVGEMFNLIPDEFPTKEKLKVAIKDDELTLTNDKGFVQKLKKAK